MAGPLHMQMNKESLILFLHVVPTEMFCFDSFNILVWENHLI